MNLSTNFRPEAATTRRALDLLPHPTAAPAAPESDGKFTVDDIICPFLRTAYNEKALEVDEHGNAHNLPEVLREFAGASWAMTGIANHAAKKLSADGNWEAFKADSFNLQDLIGSTLDHTGDSRILRGGFNQERLDAALSFSTDGERLTLADLRRFQEANLSEEPGKRGEIFGAAEFSLIVKTFGRTDAMGTRFIRNQDFVSLFKDNKWPQDWERPQPGSLNFWSTGMILKDYFSAEESGPAALAATAGAGSTKAGAGGGCPFLTGQPYDMAEAAKHHNDKLA